MIAPAMPVIMQDNKTTISFLAIGINRHFNYSRYFSMVPVGPKEPAAFSDGRPGVGDRNACSGGTSRRHASPREELSARHIDHSVASFHEISPYRIVSPSFFGSARARTVPALRQGFLTVTQLQCIYVTRCREFSTRRIVEVLDAVTYPFVVSANWISNVGRG
jgi:hypothetical protein